MFPDRFFPNRMFAPRFWPKVGATVVIVDHGLGIVEACQLYSPGAEVSQLYSAGVQAVQCYSPGAEVAQIGDL